MYSLACVVGKRDRRAKCSGSRAKAATNRYGSKKACLTLCSSNQRPQGGYCGGKTAEKDAPHTHSALEPVLDFYPKGASVLFDDILAMLPRPWIAVGLIKQIVDAG